MVDLHTHDMFSIFDGFGKPLELAQLAKDLGHTSLATSNHGNTCGLVQTYNACKQVDIKPILGVEGYFLPVYIPQHRGYHLCLFAKNLEGYKNLNTIQYEGEKQKYYNPIWTFELLEKYHEGLICTTACVASYTSKAILAGKEDKAAKCLDKLQSIFGDDLYVEIQPYKVSDEGVQEEVNVKMFELAGDMGIKCILTSDSHRGRKDDFDTYLKMHEINGHAVDWVEGTYKERYKPTEWELKQRFVEMHGWDYGKLMANIYADMMIQNLEEIESKVDADIFEGLELKLPKATGSNNSRREIIIQLAKGLKARGKYTKKYLDRCKAELDVIDANGYIDYFLIVADYVRWAKSQGIVVGPGRGSVCNCLLAYALHITDVDSIYFNLDFNRFMRLDKKEMPDIDVDFETARRDEVIDYIIKKYPGMTAKVASYGMYKVDNLINDLAKVCGLPTDKETVSYVAKANKNTISAIKGMLKAYINDDDEIEVDALYNGARGQDVREYNNKYDGIIDHFCKLYNKIRYIGTHAAGVVITSGNLLSYTALRLDKEGNIYTSYDLNDLMGINLVKFDLLGLKTMQSLGECRRLTKIKDFDVSKTEDKRVLDAFRDGLTCGIFQFENKEPKKILKNIECDNFTDIIATNAMNRPAPLEQKTPDMYAKNKKEGRGGSGILAPYLKETYGTIVFQEQLLNICTNVGGLEWPEADVVLKANKKGSIAQSNEVISKHKSKTGTDLKVKFINGAIKSGMPPGDAKALWDNMLKYTFNKGHATGYSLISAEEMWYKVHCPIAFWYTKIKYAKDEKELKEFCVEASNDGIVIFLPHVNRSRAKTTICKIDGEYAIQLGLSTIKGLGEKAAQKIVDERKRCGIYTSYDNFYDRCKGSAVKSDILAKLSEDGALEFSWKKYVKRTTTYNIALKSRGQRIGKR